MFNSNASSADAGGANYIEDVFSTYLYTGNATSTQTINNGIDLAGKGGLFWIKNRTSSLFPGNYLFDTVRGVGNGLISNTTAAQGAGYGNSVTSTGFVVGGDNATNQSGITFASWTFQEQPKFIDVVTYTGNGVLGRVIPHSLGSVPGCIIVKSTSGSGSDYPWMVYHRSLGATKYLQLESTNAAATWQYAWNNTEPTSTGFTVSSNSNTNESGQTYVAYLFAHNAGGFGLTGTDNVISCGSYTGTGSTPLEVNLGYEPQWVLIKRTDGAVSWYMGDVMRGLANTSSGANTLQPNTSNAEQNTDFVYPTATGFAVNSTFSGFNASGGTYIYIAIRRGPMKVPTDGTSVYNGIARTGTGAATNFTGAGFTPDYAMIRNRTVEDWVVADRLRGGAPFLATNGSNAEQTAGTYLGDATFSSTMDGIRVITAGAVNASGNLYINYLFRRAPGFFDEVCYTGTGVARTINHNLTVAPELMIVKNRTGADAWYVTGDAFAVTEDIILNSVNAKLTNAANRWNSTRPTASVFSVGTGIQTNDAGDNYVWYGFASCPGVSKVGSYTGTGTTQQINCGFTAGSRFVMIKRTDSTGDWYVWDSARGIVAGNDPYLLLNSIAAEVTSTDYIDTYSAGFEISSTAPAAINASGGTFIFLAIA